MEPGINKQMKQRILDFLNPVDDNNFNSYFHGLLDLILSYKGHISKKELIDLLIDIREKVNNEAQDELVCEIVNRLEGYCGEKEYIQW